MERRSKCPVACALDLVGDRWTLLVIRDLVMGKRSFDQFLASPEGIATNILSARLRKLQDIGYVSAIRDLEDGRRVRYALTPEGESLRELLGEIAKWGAKYLPGTSLPSQALEKLRRKPRR